MARSALSRGGIGAIHPPARPDARLVVFGALGVGTTGLDRLTDAIDPAVGDPASTAVAFVAGGGVMVTVGAAGLLATSHPVTAIMARVRIKDPIEARIALNLLIEVTFPGVRLVAATTVGNWAVGPNQCCYRKLVAGIRPDACQH